MFHDQGIPIHLCAEACNTAIYVKKICPHRVLGMSAPEEVFTGKKLDVSHFKIFGSSVYVDLTKDTRKKLEPSAVVGIFLGYTETPHNYHVYFPKFDEGKAMWLSLGRELDLYVEEELLVLK